MHNTAMTDVGTHADKKESGGYAQSPGRDTGAEKFLSDHQIIN
jgi:hypothetical protein